MADSVSLTRDEGALVKLLATALNSTWDGFSIWRAIRDQQDRIIDFELLFSNEKSNNPQKALTAKLLHKPISEVILNGDTERIKSALRKALEGYVPNSKLAHAQKIDGWEKAIENTVIPLTSEEVLIAYQDLADESDGYERSHWLYEHDPLTGLINQVLLEDLLNDALLKLQSDDDQFAFGILDIDDFRKVNVRFGRRIGDIALRKFAETFQGELRNFDRLIRLGEDDFAFILRHVHDLSELTELSKRLMEIAAKGWNIEGQQIRLKFSAGFILVRDHFASTQEIFQLAQSQMYKVKNHGKNGFVSSIFHGYVSK